MDPLSFWGLVVVAALVGVLAGVFLSSWRARQVAEAKKRIPRQWPLSPRVVVNTEERRVWRWLSRVFFDHHVMVKMPVTRFTMPRSHENGQYWYDLLTGVYCTFTVCTLEGRVVGCVDVSGVNRISRSNRQLKSDLLAQCGIAYWVIDGGVLPTLAEIRTEFLGELATVTSDRERDEAMVAAAQLNLRTVIERQRTSRDSDMAPLEASSSFTSNAPASLAFDSIGPPDSESGGNWQQANSFLLPLDSRFGEPDPKKRDG